MRQTGEKSKKIDKQKDRRQADKKTWDGQENSPRRRREMRVGGGEEGGGALKVKSRESGERAGEIQGYRGRREEPILLALGLVSR